MNKKLEYLTPEVDVFTVQTEGVICESTGDTVINDWTLPGEEFPIIF